MSIQNGVPANWPRVVGLGRSEEDQLFVELCADGARGEERKVLSARDIHERSKELFEWTANLGHIAVGRNRMSIAQELARQVEAELNSGRPVRRVVTARGWSGGGDFATLYGVHSAGAVPMISGALSFASTTHLADLKSAQAYYERVGTGNPLVMFLIMVSLAAPLLKPLAFPHQPWFVLVGDTTLGKSTLLQVASSIWGGELRGPLGNVHSFSGTVNGLEQDCAKARDILFTLDDIEAVTSRAIERAIIIRDLVHRTSGGTSRARHDEPIITWRNITATASNHPMPEIFAAGNIAFDGPLQVRLIELPCTERYGVFSRIPSDMSPAHFAERAVAGARKFRGVAGERFIGQLVKELAEDKDALVRELRGYVEELKDELRPYQADPVANRILDTCGIVYAAGRLAKEYRILRWSAADLRDAVVRTYIQSREFVTGEVLQANAAYTLSRYLAANTGGIFTIPPRQAKKARPPSGIVAIELELPSGGREYCMTPEQLQRALGGLQKMQEGLKQLRKECVLLVEANGDAQKLTCKRQIGRQRLRYYCFDAARLRAVANRAAQIGDRTRITATPANETILLGGRFR